MEKMYQKTGSEVLEEMESRLEGLHPVEVQKRQQQYGKNELPEGKKKPVPLIFLGQFADVLVLILIAAAVISPAV